MTTFDCIETGQAFSAFAEATPDSATASASTWGGTAYAVGLESWAESSHSLVITGGSGSGYAVFVFDASLNNATLEVTGGGFTSTILPGFSMSAPIPFTFGVSTPFSFRVTASTTTPGEWSYGTATWLSTQVLETGGIALQDTNPRENPEPATWLLAGVPLVWLAWRRRAEAVAARRRSQE